MSLLFAMNLITLDANAQDQDLFIRIGASGNYYWGDDDCTTNFAHRISPSVKLTVGKWFNPYWGVQLGGNYGKLRGAAIATTPGAEPYNTATGLSPYTTGEKVVATRGETGRYGTYHEKWSFYSIQPEVVFNVSNSMCGFNDQRVWNVIAHAGPHFSHSYANGESANSILLTAGLTNTWRLCRNVQLWADASLTLFDKGFDKVTYREGMDGMAAVSVGVSCNFGK